MCAPFEAKFSVTQLVETFSEVGIGLVFRGGIPNLEPREEVRPTNSTLLVRAGEGDSAEGVMAGFGFDAPVRADGKKGGPVINFRTEGRHFTNKGASGRALIPVSGFYEFTGDATPKTRWRLHAPDNAPLMLAALWRATGEDLRFSLLTAEPGPDVAPFHTRGVMPLPADHWADWLFDRASSELILKPPKAGTLTATPAPRPSRKDQQNSVTQPTLF
ncbi:SOS response-associated peptidase family protein [uncultured Brevundimonas sp.]|uniref:SOS response-associated peptidase family protein n=1 Tax=uncultured Brevundimonas sp. TaxID=213418 RepID=UPI002605E2C4|nr:SOS response-associated peptidase family protein [uncultured Brevundimonas sp.]